MADTIKFTLQDVDNEGEFEEEHALPAKYDVCLRCKGKGTHTNPNIDGNGITSSEWAEEWDEESRENYMAGVYDVTCETCGGLRVELVVDEEHLNADQKKIYERYLEEQREVSRENYEDAYTRRMESGGYG